MDETCLTVGTVAGEGSFQGAVGMRAVAGVDEEVDSGECFKEIVCCGSEERMWKPSASSEHGTSWFHKPWSQFNYITIYTHPRPVLSG